MATGAQNDGAPDTVSLGDMRVFANRPLPELRTGANTAFAAEARDQSSSESYALVCDPAALPRLDVLPTLRKIEGGGGVVLPQAWRVVDWPATQRRHVVIGFDKPAGGRLVRSLEETVPARRGRRDPPLPDAGGRGSASPA